MPVPRPVLRPVLLLLACLAALLTAQPAHAAPALTPQQGRVVLDLVDDLCGDTWCEGDVAFAFQRCSCDDTACRLRVRLAPLTSSHLRWSVRTATIPARAYDELVVTYASGAVALRWEVYEELSAEVSRLEASLP